MSFSPALSLTDLNDFLGPSQICIKPVEAPVAPPEPAIGRAATEIRIDGAGGAYEHAGPSEPTKLQKAQISLNDCLACRSVRSASCHR